MARYDRFRSARPPLASGDWFRPHGGVSGHPYDRTGAGERPGVGGYRGGYRGGSGGIRTGGARGPRYDAGFREFDIRARPRYSPVGGSHAAVGGSYLRRRLPEPLRDARRTSEWTRWF